MLMLIVFSAASGISTASAQDDIPALFSEVVTAADMPVQDLPEHVIRSRLVSVNFDLLDQADTRSRPLAFNLFKDSFFTGVVNRTEQVTDNSISRIGALTNVENGYFYLVTYKDTFMAHIASPEGIYEVAWAGNGLYRVIEIDQSKFADHKPGTEPTLSSNSDIVEPGSLGPTADDGSLIDIMVIYTDDARRAAGGTNAMKALINLAVTETNQSYANAGIIPRLRLVHSAEVNYAETGDMVTDLNRIRTKGDGYMDGIHIQRDTFGADMVGLIVKNGGAYCGLASTINANAGNAFQVTDNDCVTGYYSFGHEFGHLQGARHDVYVDPSTSPYAYGHGYVYTPDRWRTIMAYNTQCVYELNTNCTRLQYWSNPTNLYGGAAMGVPDSSENYKVLNNTAYKIANFRQIPQPVSFYSDMNTSHPGWGTVNGTWKHVHGKYYMSKGATNKYVSIKYTESNVRRGTYSVRMKRTGCRGCANGLIIRGKPKLRTTARTWVNGYYFLYKNDGSFSVWEINGRKQTPLKQWTYTSAIKKGLWNTLKVVFKFNKMTFYINGKRVAIVKDGSFPTGKLGITFFSNGVSKSNKLLVNWATLNSGYTDILYDKAMLFPED